MKEAVMRVFGAILISGLLSVSPALGADEAKDDAALTEFTIEELRKMAETPPAEGKIFKICVMPGVDAVNQDRRTGNSRSNTIQERQNFEDEISLEELEKLAELSFSITHEPIAEPDWGRGKPTMKPQFVYIITGPDPMLIPFVREEVLANELMDEARLAMHHGDPIKALESLNEISELYPDSEVAALVPDLRNEALESARTELPSTEVTGCVLPGVSMPRTFTHRITGIIVNGDPIAVIDGEIHHVGDTVVGYPDVRIEKIEAEAVTFQFKNLRFQYSLSGAF